MEALNIEEHHAYGGEGMKCLVMLPCHNEEQNLEKLVSSLHEVLHTHIPYQIVAVNDGSTDGTGGILHKLSEEYPIIVAEHKNNQGLASAFRTGLKLALEQASPEDLIVTMDADNTHNPKYIPRLAQEAVNSEVAISSRYTQGGRQLHVPCYRVLLSRILNSLIKILTRIPVNDATSGYRCYKASVLRKAIQTFGKKLIESKGFEVSYELLLKTYRCSGSVKEVPNTLDYSRKLGKSKIRIMPTILSYILLLGKTVLWKPGVAPSYESRYSLQSSKRVRRSRRCSLKTS